MRLARRLTLAFPLLVALALPTAAAASPEGVDIRRIDTGAFPVVRLTVSIPGAQQVAPSALHVTENGDEVASLRVRSLTAAGTSVSVVVVVDVSGSMLVNGAISSAAAAATHFVQSLPSDIKVGVLTFSDAPRVVAPISADHGAALRSLARLQARGETALYDAVVRASQMFTGAGQRNMVLLSDGGDTRSKTSLKTAASAAASAHAAVFSVGLKTTETDVNALQTISRISAGRYAPAAQADLGSIYAGLATAISNQYLISYQSSAPAGGQVSVAVSAPSGADTALVLLPAAAPVPSVPPAAPTAAPEPHPLIHGAWGFGLVVGLTFLAAFLIVLMLIGANARARRQRDLAHRMSAKPSSGAVDLSAEKEQPTWVPGGLVEAVERVAGGGFTPAIERRLERAGVPLRAGEFLLVSALSAALGGVLGLILVPNPIAVALFALLFTTVPTLYLSFVIKRRTKTMHGQLPDILMMLASSLRAGHGFLQALDTVAKEIGEPVATDLGRVVAEVRLGRGVDEAMADMAERIGSEDFQWAAMAVAIQREIGGNLAEILDTVAETVREREQIRRQIDVLSAESRLSMWILVTLPFLIALYIAKINPKYMKLLFTTRPGLVLVGGAGVLMISGIFWMRKLVRIDV